MNKWIFRISIALNVVLLTGYLLDWFSGPTYKLGRLEKDVTIGHFGSDSAMFKLPKGLTVRNISQRGLAAIGQFENERFELVITSDDANLVNYKLSEDSLQQFGNFYSADVKKYDK